MPLDRETNTVIRESQDFQGNPKFFILAVLTFAALLTSLLLDSHSDTYPSASRIALRINHNVTSAYDASREFLKEDGNHDLEGILQSYDQALEYVEIALNGGKVDGVAVQPLETVKLRKDMDKIGTVVRKLRNTTIDFLSQEIASEEVGEFEHIFSNQYFELQELTTRFAHSSRSFLHRNHDRFRMIQIILMVAAMGFVLVISLKSKKTHAEKLRALSLVAQIEERRKLAIEGANLGTWDWNISTGEIVFNKRWAEMLGLENDAVKPNYHTWENLVHPEDLPRVLKELKESLSGKSSRLFSEYRMWAQPGHWIWVLDLGKVLERDSEGHPVRAAGTHLDITKQKTAELKLISEKTKAQQYLDLAGVLFVALDAKGIVTMINRKGCQILGLPADYIVGRNWMENFVPKRIRDDVQIVANDLMDVDLEIVEYYVNPIVTASGSEVLIAWRNSVLYDEDGNISGHLSSGMDITKQRNHEIALGKYQKRLQSLASQMATTEDRLRQEIAAGLHDSIGQNLAALKLSIDLLGLNLKDSGNIEVSTVQNDLAQASKTIDQIVQETWSLSFQLSPPGLYESGIGSALEWLVARFNEKYNCRFVMISHDHPLPREKDGRGLLFQMVRELMINAVKNGAATKVDISLSSGGHYLLAAVSDNGCGFDSKSTMAEGGDVGGFGLFSIKERLAYISGSLEIESTIGHGSRVIIRFPTGEIDFTETEIYDENQNYSG